MNEILKEFKERFEKHEIKGVYKWFFSYHWQEQDEVLSYIDALIGLKKLEEYSVNQQTIIHLLRESQMGILNMKDTKVDVSFLDDDAMNELMLFYGLNKQKERYDEIKSAISSPSSFMTRIPYSVIYGLYKREKVSFDKEIFVACLIRYNVWHGASATKELSEESLKKFEIFFPQDAFTLDVLMTVFEMELGVGSAFYVEREFNIAAVIFALIKNAKLSKFTIQEKIFEAFNNPLLNTHTQAWMKNLYNDLELSLDDEIATQEQMIGLLLNDANMITNFSIQKLKKMSVDVRFDWELLIASLESVVYKEKLNGGLKILLAMVYKKVKKEPKLLEEVCINIASIFLQTDAKVQEAGQKIYDLLPVPNEKVKEALLPFVETMHFEVKQGLSLLLDEDLEPNVELALYVEKVYEPLALENDVEISYIKDEDDFIFMVSKVLKSPNYLDYELFLEGLTRFYGIKERHEKELKPALKQAKKFLDEYAWISHRMGIHHRVIALLIVVWLDDSYQSIEEHRVYWEAEIKKKKGDIYRSNQWLSHFRQFSREEKLGLKLRAKHSILPFLSTPTHQNAQLSPTVLLERLERYMVANETPNQGDFDLALCRLNRWSKISIFPRSEYEEIVLYMLNKEAKFEPKKMKTLEKSWLVAFALKNPKKALQSVLNHRNQKVQWWESETWDWVLEKDGQWARFNLGIDTIDNNKILDSGFLKIEPYQNHFSSYLDIQDFFVADESHWFARNPFLLEFIYLKSLEIDYRNTNYWEADETKSILSIVIKSAENPMPLGSAGCLYLVLSLFHKENSVRVGTLDWLFLLVENNYLDIDIFTITVTRVLANKYEHFIPIARVCEQFEQLLQSSGSYLEVLEKTLESIISKMDASNLPRSFSKLLHYYFEVLSITKKEIPPEVKDALYAMKSKATVKKEVIKILNIRITI